MLESHYEKHGKEMGFVSSEEYEMAASDAVNNPESLHKTEKEDGMMCTIKRIPTNLWLYPRIGIFETILIQILVRNILIDNKKGPNIRSIIWKFGPFIWFYAGILLFKIRTKTGMTISWMTIPGRQVIKLALINTDNV